jgi:hypothetical protein
MRTTIDIPDELFREAKLRAVHDGLRLKELLRRFVEQGLMTASSTSTPITRRSRSELPVVRTAAGKKLPSLTNAEINRLMDEEDVEDAHVAASRPSGH